MEIINEYTILKEVGTTWGISWFTLFLIPSIAVVVMCTSEAIHIGEINAGSVLYMFLAIIAVIPICLSFHQKPIYEEKVQYEILVDDDTTFSEVFDKYKIIDERGSILIVEEREK